MKQLINKITGIALLSLLLLIGTQQRAGAQNISVSFQTFYDELSPYGQWVYDPQYGDVWVPDAGGDFRPYGYNGRWAMTEYGNTWLSNDPYGWAVYHYGRWTYDPYYGWVWIPGYEWAPAWVSWRYGGGYAGWAPLGPNVSIGISWAPPVSWWVFVSPRYMYNNNWNNYWRGPSYNTTYINQTTIINNYYTDNSTRVRYNYGPRAEVIQRTTGQRVPVYRVAQTNRPGAARVENNRVALYRPSVDRNTVRQARPANRIEAPRAIQRTPQAAPAPSRERQPEFRQQIQRGEIQRGGVQRGGQPEQGGRQQIDRQRSEQGQQLERQQIERQRNEQGQRQQVERQQQIERQRNEQGQRQQMERQQQIERQRNEQGQRQQVERQQQMERQQAERQQQVERQRNEQAQRQQAERQQQVERQRNEQAQRQQAERQQQVERQRNEQAQRQQAERQQQVERQRNEQMQRQQQADRQQQMQRQQAPPPQMQRQQQAPPQRQNPQQGQPQQGRPERGGGRR